MCNNYQVTYEEYCVSVEHAHPGIADEEIERCWRELPVRHKLEVKPNAKKNPKKVKAASMFDAPAKEQPNKKRRAIDHTEIVCLAPPFVHLCCSRVSSY